MLVVKLGGSLQTSPFLSVWLQQIADNCERGLVVVPGGGIFADAVRQMQQRWKFSDDAAHELALAAMDQSARMLAGLQARFSLCSTVAQIRRGMRENLVPVWQPARALGGSDNVERSWQTTSDSLAAWLAARLKAHELLLVKCAAAPAAEMPVAELASAGLVDACFPHYLERAGARCWYARAEQSQALAPLLAAIEANRRFRRDLGVVRALA